MGLNFSLSNPIWTLLSNNENHTTTNWKEPNETGSGLYIWVCNIGNNVYVGQSRNHMNLRHKEQLKYTRTNNSLPDYALHILENRHEYVTIADTLQLLKKCQKDRLWLWEALYILIFRPHKLLITEQQLNDTIPRYYLANITRFLPCGPCERKVKSHPPFASTIRNSPYSPR